MINFLKTYAILLLFFFTCFTILKFVMNDYRNSQNINFNPDQEQY